MTRDALASSGCLQVLQCPEWLGSRVEAQSRLMTAAGVSDPVPVRAALAQTEACVIFAGDGAFLGPLKLRTEISNGSLFSSN